MKDNNFDKMVVIPVIDSQTKHEIPNMKVNFVSWFLNVEDPLFHIIHLN